MGGTEGTAVIALGTALLLAGLSFYARMKGRSGWWGLLGFLSILGLVGLAVLPSFCHGCGGTKIKDKRCQACGAPSGA
jgi:predicted cobalt transporter CbtA